jgi:flavin reductase (DIM6/NTAB) family NADH-FMN oxidoreductase RutF
MRKNLKPKAYIYPLPVLIVGTYDENEVPDAMNAAWGTVCDTAQVAVVLSAGHKTVKNLLKTQAFTVSIADAKNVAAADYVGLVSANDVPDKLVRAGFHTEKSEVVNAPIIVELPMTLECKLLKFNEDGICVGDIVNVSADESVLDENGRIDAKLLAPIIYDGVTHAYWGFGEKVGQAFSDGKAIK